MAFSGKNKKRRETMTFFVNKSGHLLEKCVDYKFKSSKIPNGDKGNKK